MREISLFFFGLIKIILALAIANGLWYLVFSFIEMDWNPMHWWLVTSFWGRIIIIVIELSIISNIPSFWDQFEL